MTEEGGGRKKTRVDAVDYLRSLPTIRERTSIIFEVRSLPHKQILSVYTLDKAMCVIVNNACTGFFYRSRQQKRIS